MVLARTTKSAAPSSFVILNTDGPCNPCVAAAKFGRTFALPSRECVGILNRAFCLSILLSSFGSISWTTARSHNILA